MSIPSDKAKYLYIFLDEGGNFDFSEKGTKFFTLTCATLIRPFDIYSRMRQCKYDLIEYGVDIQHFHCAEDNPHIRQKIFALIGEFHGAIRLDSLVVEKKHTEPKLQEPNKFYPAMLSRLIKSVIEEAYDHPITEVIIITDRLPTGKKKELAKKAIKTALRALLPDGCKYRIMHHASSAHYGLQIADYGNWAIFRRWERGEDKYWQQIQPCIKSETKFSQ